MKEVKSIILVSALFASIICAKAQVNYTYDNNGNRTKRELYVGPPLGERSFTPLPPLKEIPLPDDAAMQVDMVIGVILMKQ